MAGNEGSSYFRGTVFFSDMRPLLCIGISRYVKGANFPFYKKCDLLENSREKDYNWLLFCWGFAPLCGIRCTNVNGITQTQKGGQKRGKSNDKMAGKWRFFVYFRVTVFFRIWDHYYALALVGTSKAQIFLFIKNATCLKIAEKRIKTGSFFVEVLPHCVASVVLMLTESRKPRENAVWFGLIKTCCARTRNVRDF